MDLETDERVIGAARIAEKEEAEEIPSDDTEETWESSSDDD